MAHGGNANRFVRGFQQVENVAIAVAVLVAWIQLDFAWWWLLVLFLLWDLSMLGYVSSPHLGAWTYNVVHSYVGPGALIVLAWVTDEHWAAFVGLAWAFHVAVDRAMGYGLKFTDRFTHTHLGEIGPKR